jgi:hypothetical protein
MRQCVACACCRHFARERNVPRFGGPYLRGPYLHGAHARSPTDACPHRRARESLRDGPRSSRVALPCYPRTPTPSVTQSRRRHKWPPRPTPHGFAISWSTDTALRGQVQSAACNLSFGNTRHKTEAAAPQWSTCQSAWPGRNDKKRGACSGYPGEARSGNSTLSPRAARLDKNGSGSTICSGIQAPGSVTSPSISNRGRRALLSGAVVRLSSATWSRSATR